MSEPQNYANHPAVDKQLYAIAGLVLVAIVLTLVSFLGYGRLLAVGQLLLAVAVIGGWFRMRGYAVTLQDRIIRLEMRLRLAQVLPDDLRGRINELTVKQLIGLRFASDAELPELTKLALDGTLVKADDIKKRVKDWQADHLRV